MKRKYITFSALAALGWVALNGVIGNRADALFMSAFEFLRGSTSLPDKAQSRVAVRDSYNPGSYVIESYNPGYYETYNPKSGKK